MSRPSPPPASATGLPPAWRVPLLVLGFFGLLVGTGAGLARLGWSVPETAASAAALHGPLMICGFFGVVIALERAVAIGRYWAYLAPLLAGLGSVTAVLGTMALAPWFYLAGGLVLLAASIDVYRRQSALFTFTLALGAACWPVGVALWALGAHVHQVVAWWLGFLILTIAGERLELSRFLPPSRFARATFALVLAIVVAGMLGANRPWGASVFGVGLLALAAWLLKQDIARRTVRNKGLTRFIAICLLSGYAWLAAGGAILAWAGSDFAPGAPAYGAAMHALGLGFVFSMVFGHAAIIFPAVLRVAVPYHPGFYVPLALLHGSLLVRMAGEATGRLAWTQAGGLLNAVALAAFIASIASAVVRGARHRPPSAQRS